MNAQTHTPSEDDMLIAAEWLDVYEGGEEADQCKRVAQWLRRQADAKCLRRAAREAGVPVKVARVALAKATGAA